MVQIDWEGGTSEHLEPDMPKVSWKKAAAAGQFGDERKMVCSLLGPALRDPCRRVHNAASQRRAEEPVQGSMSEI